MSPQLTQLMAAGCRRVFEEWADGAAMDRPQFQKLFSLMGAGDVLVVLRVDRISRDWAEFFRSARDLQEVGVGIRSICEPDVDTATEHAEDVLKKLHDIAKSAPPLKSRESSGPPDLNGNSSLRYACPSRGHSVGDHVAVSSLARE